MQTPTVITEEDRATYERDGVVCIRNVYPQDRAAELLALWEEVAADLEKYGLEHTSKERRRVTPGAYAIKHLSRKIPAFKPFVMDSPVPATLGDLVGLDSVGFYWDQFFVKNPGTEGRTPWHNDAPGHPLKGEHIIGAWMPLTPVDRDNGLECIAASHKSKVRYWPATANGDHTPPPPDRARCPDFEERRGDPRVTFLGWEMEPGDVLFIHPRTLHFSCGNRTTDRRRVAYATWWHGDDIVWDPRPEAETGPPDVDFANVPIGERPSGDAFPIVWRKN
jgi:ectoine hydroxylase-related dioxygenase (phytanoyl-CoA dioxygenase family)